jgi:hypothetical protein
LVNPIGGKGNAMSLVNSLALPVYRAAGCEVDVIGELDTSLALSISLKTLGD